MFREFINEYRKRRISNMPIKIGSLLKTTAKKYIEERPRKRIDRSLRKKGILIKMSSQWQQNRYLKKHARQNKKFLDEMNNKSSTDN